MSTPKDFLYYLGTRRAKADYQYDITDDYIILIQDLDQGNVSVTNDIANVLADIMRDQDRKNLTGYRVLYRDSEGNWDEALLGENGLFKQFGGNGGLDKAAALTIMRSKYFGR